MQLGGLESCHGLQVTRTQRELFLASSFLFVCLFGFCFGLFGFLLVCFVLLLFGLRLLCLF